MILLNNDFKMIIDYSLLFKDKINKKNIRKILTLSTCK